MKIFIFVVPIIIQSSIVFAQQNIRVVDQDIKDQGIACEIHLEKKDGKLELVSYSDIDGYVKKEFVCDELEKVIFVPEGDYFKRTIRCPIETKEVYLSSIKYQRNLIVNAEFYFREGKFGASALAFTEVAARYRGYDSVAAANASAQAYVATSKLLGVSTPYVFDPLQEKTVMSPELLEALTKFQLNNDIKATGKLDYKTLSIGSEVKLHEMLYKSIDGPLM